MPLSYSKSSSMLLQDKLTKSNVRSPKSVKVYIKEMNDEEKLKNIKKTSSPNDENPTQLNNVLNALKLSSKKKINFSQNNDEEEEICDFKNIGNLSNISFNPDNSFVEILSEDENDEEALQDEITNEQEEKRYIRLDEERENDCESSDEDLGHISNLNSEIIMSRIQSEQERLHHSKTQFLKLKTAYLQNLSEIRNSACQKLHQLRLEEQNNQVREKMRMEEIQKAGSEQVLLAEENYMKDVTRKRDEILREVEALNLEEERKAGHIQSLIDTLHRDINTFKISLSSIQLEAQNLGCEGDLIKILFQELPSICETTQNTLSIMNKFSTKEAEVDVISRRIVDALKIVGDIQRILESRKEQKTPRKEEKSQTADGDHSSHLSDSIKPDEQTPLPAPNIPLLPPYPQRPTLTITENRVPGMLSHQTSLETDPSLRKSEEFFISLKTKFAKISEEANKVRENAQLRPLLSRAVGIINTLSNEKYDSSNKSKLQQILNLINGRSCTIGSDEISTANNSSAQAFVKEQLASRLVTLGHDKQVATMSAYASLIVRLWQWYPDVGELILFKLYETCPYLIPLVIKREFYQTDEDFYRALGMRVKEGGTQEALDKYLTRMESTSQLYGRIVSMQVENHPHGIQEGWKWIGRTVSMQAQPTIVAALLFGFLSTAGAPLLSHYGKQFKKLLEFICTTYLPDTEKGILEGGRSAVVGLRSLLEQYQRTNSMPQVPEGYKLIL